MIDVMISIPEAPDVPVCAGCYHTLSWLYSARTSVWVAFVSDPDDRLALRVHRCRLPVQNTRRHLRLWRQMDVQPPEVRTRGARRARAALAAIAQRIQDQRSQEHSDA